VGIHSVSVSKDERVSNAMPFAVDTLPEGLDQEPNNESNHAQQLTLPVIINGRIDQPGDADVFRFEGRAGDEIVAEVQARRLDSPLDSVLKLTDAAGKQLALNDDHEDKASGLNTHHADSYLRATLPANGSYYVHLGDTQHKGGDEFAYRLHLSPPRPDFELRVVPASLTARPGVCVPLTVYALRKDGFTNEITLALNGTPNGFTLNGGRVPANQDQVRMTLTAPPNPAKEPYNLNLQGRAIIEGHAVVHPAVPAEDMMQAFAYRHLVPARELEVAVLAGGRGISRGALKILGATPVKIPAGGTARVQFATPAGAIVDRFQFELSEPPEGIALGNVTPVREGAEIVLRSDAAKVKPGQQGNLIVSIFAGRPAASAGPANRPANVRRAPIGALPAISFEIVPQPQVSGQ
ncbi:MAG: PPC domain-containing protein, partial [Verrucomicrobiota bacterium]